MLKIISACILALVISNVNSAFAAKLYKWVDNDGNISYQDSTPPEGSKLIKEEEIKTSNPKSTDQSTQSTVVFRQQPVVVYTLPNCPVCDELLQKIRSWDVPAAEESLQDRAVQARILEISDSLTVPTLFIGDNIISNHSNDSLSAALQKAGYVIESIDGSEETPIENVVPAEN